MSDEPTYEMLDNDGNPIESYQPRPCYLKAAALHSVEIAERALQVCGRTKTDRFRNKREQVAWKKIDTRMRKDADFSRYVLKMIAWASKKNAGRQVVAIKFAYLIRAINNQQSEEDEIGVSLDDKYQ